MTSGYMNLVSSDEHELDDDDTAMNSSQVFSTFGSIVTPMTASTRS